MGRCSRKTCRPPDHRLQFPATGRTPATPTDNARPPLNPLTHYDRHSRRAQARQVASRRSVSGRTVHGSRGAGGDQRRSATRCDTRRLSPIETVLLPTRANTGRSMEVLMTTSHSSSRPATVRTTALVAAGAPPARRPCGAPRQTPTIGPRRAPRRPTGTGSQVADRRRENRRRFPVAAGG